MWARSRLTVCTLVAAVLVLGLTSGLVFGQVLERSETLYSNGQQWGPVVGWNPYSSSMNNAMAIAQQDSARVIMFETPYLYNMLDGEVYPLLADGPFTWDNARTYITFKLKAAAHWSDGTPLTAYDVAYTWDSNIKYSTNAGNNFKDYIGSIIPIDAQTVLVNAKLDANRKAINPLMVAAYLSGNYSHPESLDPDTGSPLCRCHRVDG